jgi:uncharacterized integral membrane protein
MDLKLNNTNLSGKYVQVPNKNMNDINGTTDTSDIEALYQDNKVYKKTTFESKDKDNCKCYVKYSLIFSGIITIILMVIFGINNIGVEYQTITTDTTPLVVNTTTPLVVNTTTPLVVNTTTPLVVNTTTPLVVNTTTPLVVNTTTPLVPSPKQMLDMLDEDDSIESTSPENTENTEITTEQEGQDVIISNKTVIINGGNGSVVITN